MQPLSIRSLKATQRRVEEIGAYGGSVGESPQPHTIELHPVQITSTTQTAGRYPGSLYFRDGDADTFTLIGTAGGIWVDTPNGEALTTDTYYYAKLTGHKTADGLHIYDVVAMPPAIRGKLDGSLSYGGSATMSIWAWNGSSDVDTGFNVTVYDWLLSSGQTVASGKQVTATSRGGRYIVDGAQCS